MSEPSNLSVATEFARASRKCALLHWRPLMRWHTQIFTICVKTALLSCARQLCSQQLFHRALERGRPDIVSGVLTAFPRGALRLPFLHPLFPAVDVRAHPGPFWKFPGVLGARPGHVHPLCYCACVRCAYRPRSARSLPSRPLCEHFFQFDVGINFLVRAQQMFGGNRTNVHSTFCE